MVLIKVKRMERQRLRGRECGKLCLLRLLPISFTKASYMAWPTLGVEGGAVQSYHEGIKRRIGLSGPVMTL